jgi:hypothetical protein
MTSLCVSAEFGVSGANIAGRKCVDRWNTACSEAITSPNFLHNFPRNSGLQSARTEISNTLILLEDAERLVAEGDP